MFYDHDAIKSFLASVVSALSSATAALLLVGVSQDDATRLGAAVQQIGDGIAGAISFLLLMISVFGTTYVFFKQTKHFLFRRHDADPEIRYVEVLPGTEAAAVAEAIPGDKIRVAQLRRDDHHDEE